MRKNIIIILFFAVLFCFAQEEILNEISSPDTLPDVSVNTIAQIDTNEITDSITDISDSIPAKKSKKNSWYISIMPRVGADKIQKEYADFLKHRSDSIFEKIRDDDANHNQTWFRPALSSGVSFALETGISTKINEKSYLETGIGYSFNQTRAVYNIERSTDSLEVLQMHSLLVNNSLWLSADYKMRFDSSYFHIKGIDAAGFFAGGAFMLSRYFERDTINTKIEDFVEKRRRNYDGFGGSGRIGLFAQRKIGQRTIFEYSIGYLFSATTGYEGFWSRKYYWESTKNKGEILSISNSFELSFSLIF